MDKLSMRFMVLALSACVVIAVQPAVGTVFDVTVSLYRAPTGDNDPATNDERTPYEKILGYFADAVYEESNGAHKIGTVQIYMNSQYSDKCDILWSNSQWPYADVSGYADDGKHIYVGDMFPHGSWDGSDYDMLADPEGAGYTLGHEWGHYVYGLYDEYRKDDRWLHWPDSAPWDSDKPVEDAIMNSQWNAVGGNYEWLNHSTRANDTGETAQHRMFHASGWETLIREPKDDPRSVWLFWRPKRIYWSDLVGVAPNLDTLPGIDLPGTARSNFKVVWMGEELTYQIVIDCSGSMGWEIGKMENAKQAAKLLVDMAQEGTTRVGVIKFSSSPAVVQAITLIDSAQTKTTIKSKIDTIYAYGNTCIGNAALLALQGLRNLGTTGDTRVVFLLTNGMSNTGVDPLDPVNGPIPQYQADKVPMFTFAYGSDANKDVLRKLANDTGGRFYSSPTTLQDITSAFNDAFQQASPSRSVSAGASTLGSAMQTYSLVVDSTLARLDLVVTHSGAQGNASVRFFDPTGVEIAPSSVGPSVGGTLYHFRVDDPINGEWSIEATSFVGPLYFTYQASGFPSDVISYSLSLSCLSGQTVEYPAPALLLAVLEKELPIAGGETYGWVVDPSKVTSPITFRDDGVPPDAVAGDGSYSALLDYDQNGLYQINLVIDNSGGQAYLTDRGLQPSITPDGRGGGPSLQIPLGENFSRAATLQVQVQGVVADDHGNSAPVATVVFPDNTPVWGRIEVAGDVDFFKFDLVKGEEYTIRTSNLFCGMDTVLTLYNTDGISVIASDDNGGGVVSSLVIWTCPTDGTYYAKVNHAQTTGTGGYMVSVGPRQEWEEVLLAKVIMTSTLAATNIGEMSVRLWGQFVDDDGEGCWCRFSYFKDRQGLGYVKSTPWIQGLRAGEVFGQVVEGLEPGTKYWFWAEAMDPRHWQQTEWGSGLSECFVTLKGLVEVRAPNGGENWFAGTTQMVQWGADPAVSQIVLEYSVDNGATWYDLAVLANTEENKKYLWVVPDVDSAQCLIRVSDAKDPSVADVSDGVFCITRCLVPRLVGMFVNDAQAALAAAGLTLGAVKEQYATWPTCGTVMHQVVPAGTPLPAGSPVDLVVAGGAFGAGGPTMSTQAATDVGSGGARLWGKVLDDGGEWCRYRFHYWPDLRQVRVIQMTPWKGYAKKGQSFSEVITGLKPGTKYYFWVQGMNSTGQSETSEMLTFTTAP